MILADLVINHADGSVTPFPFSIQSFPTGGDPTNVTDIQFLGEQVARDSGAIGAQALTRYFVADHLGTAQFELSSGGWPVWQGQFTPYGQELDNQQSYNNYKFTGIQRSSIQCAIFCQLHCKVSFEEYGFIGYEISRIRSDSTFASHCCFPQHWLRWHQWKPRNY